MPNLGERTIHLIHEILQFLLRDLAAELLDHSAHFGDLFEGFGYFLCLQTKFYAELRSLRFHIPIKCHNLVARKANQRVSMTEGMINEGEFVISCKRDEPQREPGKINCHRVPVHAIETLLCNQTPCMQ